MGVAGGVRRYGCRDDERRIAPEVRETEDLRAGPGREVRGKGLRIRSQPGQGPALHDHELAKGYGHSAFEKRSKQ
jgi:hypothetical protein